MAILTLTPFETCSTITERAPSAASAVISKPRFIGPGCITSVVGLRLLTRSPFRPKYLEYSRALGKNISDIRSS